MQSQAERERLGSSKVEAASEAGATHLGVAFEEDVSIVDRASLSLVQELCGRSARR